MRLDAHSPDPTSDRCDWASVVFLLLGGVVLSAALAANILVSILLQCRTPPALRGDWWTTFEKDFRALSAIASRSVTEAATEKGRPETTRR